MGLEKYRMFLEEISELILSEMPKADYSSIFNDFVESEFFLIDGDSLLVMFICEESLKQGQELHFFYLVERYLVDIISKGGQFAIVFFKDAEYAYFNFPELLSLRTALILHLQHNNTIDVRTQFSGCLSQEWKSFLEESYPYFLIVADEGLNDLQTHLFNFLIIQSWSMKVNAVLSSGQASDVLRLYAYFMLSRPRQQTFFKQNEKKIENAYKALIKQLEGCRVLAFEPIFGNLRWNNMIEEASEIISLLKQLWPEGSDIRRVLCVTSCSLTLRMYHDFLENRKKTTSGQETNIQQVKGDCVSLQWVEDLCKLHCLSVVFLLHLPLSQRACTRVITSDWIEDIQTFLKMRKWCEYFILNNRNIFEFWNLNLIHLCDLSDELLLKNIAFYYENENVQGLHLNLGNDIMKDYEYLWNAVSKLVGKFDVGKPFPLRTTQLNFLKKDPVPIKDTSKEKMPSLGFIPMSSEMVDKFVGDILKDLPFLKRDDPIVTSLVKHKAFDELIHWHSHRPLSDDYDRAKSNFNGNPRDPYYLKSLQKFQVFQRFYGNSLESVSPKLIVTQDVKPKKNFSKPKTKKANETKAEIITRENRKRLLAKEEQKEENKWSVLSHSIEEEMKENLNSGIQNLEGFLKSCKSNLVKYQVEMVGLTACLKAWKEHCRSQVKGETTKDLSIAVQMMKRIHSLMEKYPEFLQEADRQLIARCLKYLGFDELASSLNPTEVAEDGIKEKKKNKYSIGIGPVRFQLQYMGHFLLRDERKDPDPRVHDFIPDTWQRELLDVVDNNESAVIVAPTSSGKTYASYYCMEKVLKESDEGVVVYVSPTKALVNQVAATVQNRYMKNLPNGETLCGIFTREYRHDALNCQVLVTVPACLEILLLAPHRQRWVKRIRYVIFDEVHCLGGEIGAEVWEHLLVMIRCPFLALSATISNPEHLTEWLQSIKWYWKQADNIIEKNTASKRNAGYRANFHKDHFQMKQSYKVRLVLYGERYNDLEKHICSVKHNDIYFDHFHPCAALTTEHIERQMSGRAGRRGQDLLGDVYFFDIPFPKIQKLIKSNVPELRGQFPFSITLVLRLMILASRGDDPEDAQAKVLSVLKHSLLSFKRPKTMEMLKLYFLFSLQFLVKEGYLDQEGNPMGFAGLVSHLHYHEPSNLVFVSFLVSGLFHNLCQPTHKGSKCFSQDVMEKLVLVLANLFGRRYIPAKFQESTVKFYQSKVFLEDLPEDFNAALHEYNMQITKDFASFLLIVSKLADMKQEYQLPLSKINFTGKECEDSQLVSHLMSCKEGRVAISPFVCLSGNSDGDLLQPATPSHVILRTIGISHAQAPVLWPHRFDSQGRRMPLNAYALDFYKHGSLTGLVQDNRMNEGDAYELLKDFSLTLQSISVSLRELCENEDDNVVLAFEQLSKTFSEKFNKV
ncbi:PREDICTED: probable ATP-dependent RNA helicase DDX60 isoform X3 [Myotis brandtii]|uniref:probable ATP-dependent RNA helicase DDX60 isoform X3 n=1 Tax=Myotis brandtii TaxID=109478 RepID=UPI00070469F1|nr:PREDICTED: probable ATP-dependent RNA helicase DDX60 isoform X3 [Myotis brandtii]